MLLQDLNLDFKRLTHLQIEEDFKFSFSFQFIFSGKLICLESYY